MGQVKRYESDAIAPRSVCLSRSPVNPPLVLLGLVMAYAEAH